MDKGTFTISLDFELFWGVRDKRALESYQENLDGVWTAIPHMLELFKEYNIHATWATVGFLFFDSFESLKQNLPTILPEYEKSDLSPYKYLINTQETRLKYHFATELIHKIRQTQGQEIASHTFSHFYTLENNSSKESFKSDLTAYKYLAEKENIEVKSIVFPRNQIDNEELKSLKDGGITIFRGNPDSWAYRNGDIEKGFWTRVYRFLDIYCNLSGYQTSLPLQQNGITEVKSSMFFRPYSKRFSFLEGLKLQRVKKAMTYAAKNKTNFHLWWHPHNFGVNQVENFKNLEEILQHYKFLHNKYGMKSLNMKELADE